MRRGGEGRPKKEITRKPLSQFVTYLSSVFCSAFHLGVLSPCKAGYIERYSIEHRVALEVYLRFIETYKALSSIASLYDGQ